METSYNTQCINKGEIIMKEEYKRPYVIAEAGCNHMGSMDIARD